MRTPHPPGTRKWRHAPRPERPKSPRARQSNAADTAGHDARGGATLGCSWPCQELKGPAHALVGIPTIISKKASFRPSHARARRAGEAPRTVPEVMTMTIFGSRRSRAVSWVVHVASSAFGSSCAASFARRGPAPLRLLQQAGVALDAPAPLFGLAVAGCMRSVHVQRPSAGRMWGMLSHQSHRAVAACCEAPAYGRYKPVRCMQLS